MATIVPITLNDGAATPVAHTFSPIGTDANGVAKYVDKSGGIAVGFTVLTLQCKEPQKGSDNYKVTGKVLLPILEQTAPSTATGIQPAPTVAYRLPFDFSFSLPVRSTALDRAHIQAYAKNIIAHAIVTAMVKDYEPVYG